METGRSSGRRKQTELLDELNAAAKGTHCSVRRSSVNDRAEGTLGQGNIIHAQLFTQLLASGKCRKVEN